MILTCKLDVGYMGLFAVCKCIEWFAIICFLGVSIKLWQISFFWKIIHLLWCYIFAATKKYVMHEYLLWHTKIFIMYFLEKSGYLKILATVQVQFSSFSCVWLFATPWTIARQAFQSITNSQSLFKLMSIRLVIPSSHLILCHLLLLLPQVPPSIRVFSNESTLCMRWAKVLEFPL